MFYVFFIFFFALRQRMNERVKFKALRTKYTHKIITPMINAHTSKLYNL